MRRALLFLTALLISFNLFALEITSDVFESKGYIPDRYTCDGKNFSPLLSWSEVPENAKSLVLISDDPDAPFKLWVHWLLFNIPVDLSELKEGISQEELGSLGIISGVNDSGQTAYQGPCPPEGKAHSYSFKLYALDSELALEEGATKKEIVENMQGHIISETKIVGLYQRQVPQELTPESEQDKQNN